MAQTVTSATTSINKTRIPAIYTKLRRLLYMFPHSILDYGCGRYTDHIRAFVGESQYFPYDPFNQSEEVNRATRDHCTANRAEMCILSNVLNVVDDDETIRAILDDAMSMTYGSVIISIYEGDRSGVGRYTGKDSYQRNMRTADYVPLLQALGFMVVYEQGLLTVIGRYPHGRKED